jgi:hypothetical protein
MAARLWLSTSLRPGGQASAGDVLLAHVGALIASEAGCGPHPRIGKLRPSFTERAVLARMSARDYIPIHVRQSHPEQRTIADHRSPTPTFIRTARGKPPLSAALQLTSSTSNNPCAAVEPGQLLF